MCETISVLAFCVGVQGFGFGVSGLGVGSGFRVQNEHLELCDNIRIRNSPILFWFLERGRFGSVSTLVRPSIARLRPEFGRGVVSGQG